MRNGYVLVNKLIKPINIQAYLMFAVISNTELSVLLVHLKHD